MLRASCILFVVGLAAPSSVAAQTMSFGDGAAMLAKSCTRDIEANCRGINIDTTRFKSCLSRNEDGMSVQCKADYPRALEAIQKRIAARAAVGRDCEYEIVKKCGGKGKEASKSLSCLLGAPDLSARCIRAIDDVGYKVSSDMGDRLIGLEASLDLDFATVRQQALDRSKAKNESPRQRLSPIAPQLNKQPSVHVDIQFYDDTPIVRPDSYQTLGQLADTLVSSALLNYTFLIIGHTASTGKRENNLLLSQRRADAVREILTNTFKISSKRLQSWGLGEEQLNDPARPSADINNQIQIITLAKIPEQDQKAVAARTKGVTPAKKTKTR